MTGANTPDLRALVERLTLMADQGDYGRPPDPTDIRRQAAAALTTLQHRVAEMEARIAAAKAVIETGGDRETGRSASAPCAHGRQVYEDCIACYDEDLIEALEGQSRSTLKDRGEGR